MYNYWNRFFQITSLRWSYRPIWSDNLSIPSNLFVHIHSMPGPWILLHLIIHYPSRSIHPTKSTIHSEHFEHFRCAWCLSLTEAAFGDLMARYLWERGSVYSQSYLICICICEKVGKIPQSFDKLIFLQISGWCSAHSVGGKDCWRLYHSSRLLHKGCHQ